MYIYIHTYIYEKLMYVTKHSNTMLILTSHINDRKAVEVFSKE